MSKCQGILGNMIKTLGQTFSVPNTNDQHIGRKVKFLRSGGIVYCKQPDGSRQYAVLTGTDRVITFTGDRQFEEHSLAEFVAAVGGKKLWVAAQNSIAVGNLRISQKAHRTREQGNEQWQGNTEWLLTCLGEAADDIDESLEQLFGSFEWKKYRITPA